MRAPPRSGLRRVPVGGGPPRAFLTEQTVNVAWSRDGRRLAYFTFAEGDRVFVANGDGSNPQQILMGAHNHFLAWSVDDKWIYYAHGTQAGPEYDVWRIPSSDGEGKEERLTHHNAYVRYVTPIDARTVLYVAPDENKGGPWLWALDVERRVTRRVSGGLERYLSVSASADGRRLVATVASSTAGLSSVPILDREAGEVDVKPHPPATGRALAPRFAGTSLFYLSSSGPGDGLWRLQDGKSDEIWKGADGALEVPAAVSPSGDRLAVVLRKQGKQSITIVSADGATRQSLPDVIDVLGTPAWSPDAAAIATGGVDADGPGLFVIPVNGGAPRRLAKGPAFDPVWSPLGNLIVYTGRQLATAPLLAVDPVDPDRKVNLPVVEVAFGGGGRSRFLPDGKGLVFLKGSVGAQDFWLLDLTTLRMRALTRLSNPATIFSFDIAPDGRHIVFDRIRENSDIRLIDLK
jgi:Tol biopolymer transport system component